MVNWLVVSSVKHIILNSTCFGDDDPNWQAYDCQGRWSVQPDLMFSLGATETGHLESYSHGSCRRYTVPTKTDIVHTLTILKSGLSWNRFGDCGWKCARKEIILSPLLRGAWLSFLSSSSFKKYKNPGVCQVCGVRYGKISSYKCQKSIPSLVFPDRGGDLCLHHPAFGSAHVPGRSRWQHPVALCDRSQRRGTLLGTLLTLLAHEEICF